MHCESFCVKNDNDNRTACPCDSVFDLHMLSNSVSFKTNQKIAVPGIHIHIHKT